MDLVPGARGVPELPVRAPESSPAIDQPLELVDEVSVVVGGAVELLLAAAAAAEVASS